MPIAHNEGNYSPMPRRWSACSARTGSLFATARRPAISIDAANPNGSQRNIAGILNDRRNVLGLMPHPERMADAELGGTDGRGLFAGLMAALAS